MKAIEKYIDALQKCDNKGLSELFTVEGSLADYCPNSSGHHEYHVYGKEAIDMFFKNKFTREQREAGPTNFIMGLAFITEGAIPFAASDPLHVLPSCIVGSGIAGALSMAFACTLMAPHGGIFVFPVVGNALMYLVALVVGTIVSAVLLGLLKKPVNEQQSA